MGGGDLNLKKSWHPQTIRNVERVWKAEQKATAEAKKIEQLQRELMEERAREDMQRHAIEHGISKKKSDRLEWMYATPGQVDREQYLLGKAIDKQVDPLANGDKEESNVPGLASNAIANNPADLAAKVRDDPLFLIKKKEEEKKKELMNNPVKMKHLRQMLQENLGKSKKKDKKRKKDKKEKKRREKDSDHRSDSEDERLHQHGNKRHERQHKHKRRSPSESPDRSTTHRHKRHSKSPSPQRLRKRRHSRSRSNDRKHKRPPSESPDRSTKHKRHSRSRSNDRRHKRIPSESPDRSTKHRHTKHSSSPQRNKLKKISSSRSNDRRRRSPSPQRNGHRDQRQSSSPDLKKSRKSYSPRRESAVRAARSRSPSPKRNNRHRGTAVTKKMSAEELEKRREEMLSNAQWRNDQRTANVKKYNETEKEEAELEVRNAGKSAKFLSNMKVQSFSSDSTASVSDRIKRNINSLQRTTAALDTFLVKK